MTINIQGTGIELTESIKDYSNDKMESLKKFFDNIQKIDVDVGMGSHHHHKGNIYYAEVNVHIPKQIVRMKKEAEDLYKAIDKVKDHLKIELQKIKDKMRDKDRKILRDQKEYHG